MFTATTVLKSVDRNCISNLIWRNVRHYSLWNWKNAIQFKSPNYHSRNDLFGLKCHHSVAKSSGLSSLSKCVCALSFTEPQNFVVQHRWYRTKSKDFNKEDDDNTSDVEKKATNVLDDLEFQSILKDFERDFGINDETKNKFLEEIKETNHNSFGSGDPEQAPNKTKATCCNHQLDVNDTAKLETDSPSLHEHKFQELCSENSATSSHSEDLPDDSSDETYYHIDQELEKPIEYDAERGETGVFDIDELVVLLKEENLLDVTVIQVPSSFNYADYMVIATAKSLRHCHVVMEHIVKCYKKKKDESDPFVIVEGEKGAAWKALDMGNIVLHVFLQDTRSFYDLESLWLLDKRYDDNDSVNSDPEIDMLQQQLDFLKTLPPL